MRDPVTIDALARAPLILYDARWAAGRRNAHLSPGTREFMALAERRVRAL